MSVINDFQVNGLFPSIVSASTASAQYFPRLLGSSIGVQSVAPSATSAAGQLVVPGNNELNGQLFSVLVAGYLTSGAGESSETATIELVANTGTVTSPVYTSIASTGAVAVENVAPGSHSFAIKATMSGDSTSGIVGGSYAAYVDGNLVNSSPKNVTATLSSINMGAAIPFGLVMRITFGAASSNNKGFLTQFQIAAD